MTDVVATPPVAGELGDDPAAEGERPPDAEAGAAAAAPSKVRRPRVKGGLEKPLMRLTAGATQTKAQRHLQEAGGWQDALAYDGAQLRHAPPELREDRELVLQAVRQSWKALEFAPEELRADREIAFEAVRQSWWALEHVAPELRAADRELALLAVRQSSCALRWVPQDLQGDADFMLQLIMSDGQALQHWQPCPGPWQCTGQELVLEAVRQSGTALAHAPASERRDRSLVQAAMAEDVEALAFASPQLRSSKKFISKAVRLNGLALRHASAELRADRSVVFAAVGQNGEALAFAAEELRESESLVREAFEQNAEALRYASDLLLEDREYMMDLVKVNGMALKFASAEIRADPRVVAIALQLSWKAIEFAQRPVAFEAVLSAVKQDWKAIEFVNLAALDHGEVARLVSAKPDLLQFPPLRGSKELVLTAVRRDGLALRFAVPSMKSDREVVEEAMQQHPEALQYASRNLQDDKELNLKRRIGMRRAVREAEAEADG